MSLLKPATCPACGHNLDFQGESFQDSNQCQQCGTYLKEKAGRWIFVLLVAAPVFSSLSIWIMKDIVSWRWLAGIFAIAITRVAMGPRQFRVHERVRTSTEISNSATESPARLRDTSTWHLTTSAILYLGLAILSPASLFWWTALTDKPLTTPVIAAAVLISVASGILGYAVLKARAGKMRWIQFLVVAGSATLGGIATLGSWHGVLLFGTPFALAIFGIWRKHFAGA